MAVGCIAGVLLLITDKTLNTVARSLAVLTQLGQRGVSLILGGDTNVLLAEEALLAVTIRVAGLGKLGQGSVTDGLVQNTLAKVVAFLVGLAVTVNLAIRGRLGLGRRSQSETGKHSRENENGLHFCGWW